MSFFSVLSSKCYRILNSIEIMEGIDNSHSVLFNSSVMYFYENNKTFRVKKSILLTLS